MLWKIVVIIVFITLLFLVFIYRWPQFLYLFFTIPQDIASQKLQVFSKPQLSSPTLEKIFESDHSWTATLSAQKKVTLIATGDVIPARSVNFQAISRKDINWPYKNIAEFVASADLTLINLETPLITNCPLTQEGMIFCGDARHVIGLKLMGVDIASLANNHSTNYGQKGVEETVKLLENNGISVTGLNSPTYQEVNGTRFAFLGYNDIEPKPNYISNAFEEKIRKEITEAKSKADVVIVTYHWGAEYKSQPDERQKYLGRLTIDAGADLVIGNHPHWIQPVEIYENKLVTYAHGNTIFDQEWSQKTKEGVIGRYIFYDKKLVDVEYFPLEIRNYGQAQLLEEESKVRVLNNMRGESLILSSQN